MADLILPAGVKSSSTPDPEPYKLDNIIAEGGFIVMIGHQGTEELSDTITVKEARNRASTLYEAWKAASKAKSREEASRLREILDNFEVIINTAIRQGGERHDV